KPRRVPRPGSDGEEHDSSPSSFPGPGQSGGFADGGPADVLAPGKELAGLLAAVTGTDGAPLRGLSDQEVLGAIAAGGRLAAKADVVLAAAGQVKNPAGLRDFARRQVARLDPDAAQRRKERARQDAHVRLWQEDSGNAGLSARQMPTADAVIAWQNIERRALD